MIYTAHFKLLVANVREALGGFLKKVEELGGYLQSRGDASVTCRVPAHRFQECLDALPAFGAVLSESVSAQDITRRYLDLGLRIENAEKSRQRLLALLEKAEKVDDILKIEQEVRRLTEEIERMKGELKYLSEQIAYSTVEVHFQSTAPEARPVFKRALSRFEWINRIGVEHALQTF
jgi:hypothetical protein